MSETTPKRPDYNLHAMNKGTDEKSKVGVAWLQANGRISIKLNAFTTLSASADLVLNLFPWNEQDDDRWKKQRESNKQAGHKPDGSPTPF